MIDPHANAERDLWIAVLDRALRDTEALIGTAERKPDVWNDRILRSEVRQINAYFRRRSMEPGGFGFVCTLMDVDAGHAARRIDEIYLRRLTMPVEQRPARLAMLLAI